MGKRVHINRVGGASPGLNLLSDLLCVGWGEDTNGVGILKIIRQRIEEISDSIRKSDRSEYTRAK